MRFLVVWLCLLPLCVCYDPLSAHGGLLKSLPFDDAEMHYISQLHATADYHQLMRVVTQKMDETVMSPEDRKGIEKFLLKMRPPTALRQMLSEDEKETVRDMHSRGDIGSSMSVVEQGIQRLPYSEKRTVVEYIWPNPQPYMYEHFNLEP